MLNLTHQALEKFDNQHDYERMGADILNSLGYKDVVLIAPRGGGDSGRDITYTTSDGGKGLACVSLRKDIEAKFKEDFGQRRKGEYDEYTLFTTQYLTASQKLDFAKYCANELNASFTPRDIEGTRSLLDSALQSVRELWLHIETDRTPIYKLWVTDLVRYSASDLHDKALEAYSKRRQDFLSKSSMAGVMPIRIAALGAKSTEQILTELEDYAQEIKDLKGRVSKILSFNISLSASKSDSNIEVQLKSQDGTKLTMDDNVIKIPRQPSENSLSDLYLGPNISSVHSKDDDEFYARYLPEGGIKSNLKTINPNQPKAIFDTITFMITKDNVHDLDKIHLKAKIYSANLDPPQEEDVIIDLSDARLIELGNKN